MTASATEIIPDTSYAEVPEDLLAGSAFVKRIHQIKSAAVVRACVPLQKLLPPPRPTMPGILMYHRVVDDPTGLAPTWNVTPDRFREQLQGLLDAGYQALPLTQLVEASDTGAEISNNAFAVTFDDGYANNFLHALPILEELNVPATIFLATAYLDSVEPFPFDDWEHKGSREVAEDTWRALTTAECHEFLESDLIEFGCHTHTHEDFRDRPDAFRQNIRTSIRSLRDTFGIQRPTLSLPYGIEKEGFAGPTYFRAAEAEGACCCLTTEEGLVSPDNSPFGWGRFIAEQHDTASTLAVKFDGWRDVARDCWRRLRGTQG